MSSSSRENNSKSPSPTDDFNAQADFYYDVWGVNVIPAPTIDKGKEVKDRQFSWISSWDEFQTRAMTKEEHEQFKANGDYTWRKGIAITAGKVWRGQHAGEWLIFIDCDNQLAIDRLSDILGYKTLEEASKECVIEQRDNAKDRAHFYFYSKSPFVDLPGLKTRKNKDKEIALKLESNLLPAIEVKSHGGLAFVAYSYHVSGDRYKHLGVSVPKRVLSEAEAEKIMSGVELLHKEYGFSYLENVTENGGKSSIIPVAEMLEPEYRVVEGNNRHLDVKKIAMHYIRIDPENAFGETWKWNNEHCIANKPAGEPEEKAPLSREEVEELFEGAINYLAKQDALEAQSRVGMLPTAEEGEDDDDEDSKAKKKKRESLKALMIKTAVKLVEDKAKLFFRDEYHTPLVKIQNDNHYEIMRIDKKSKMFTLYVAKLYYDSTKGGAIKEDALREAIRTLAAKAIFSGNVRKLHLRTAWEVVSVEDENGDEITTKNAMYYDPCTRYWSSIKLDSVKGQWEILPEHPDQLMFFRFGQKAQVAPTHDYRKDILDEFLDMMRITNANDRILMKVWLIACFIAEIAHPILIPHGAQGSAKSTFCRFIKRTVDPNMTELLTIPSRKEEATQHAHHHALLIYDNVDKIPEWFSDFLCQLVTGADLSKRKLYSDDEDFAYNFKRIAILNGLHVPLTKPDALDRSIMIHFERIPNRERKTESEIDAKFKEMLPHLLGKILDVLVRAMKIHPTVKLESTPRMADFSTWGVAIAQALAEMDNEQKQSRASGTSGAVIADFAKMQFLNAYSEIIERQNVDVVEATSVGPVLLYWFNESLPDQQDEAGDFYRKNKHWEGTPGELLVQLNQVAERLGTEVKDKDWPKKPHNLMHVLKPIVPDLRNAYNLDVHIYRDTTGEHTSKNSTWIEIRKIENVGKNSSTSSTAPPGANSRSKSGSDGGAGGAVSGATAKNSSTKKGKIHAQYEGGGAGGHSGADFTTSVEISQSQAQASSISAITLVKYKSVSVDLEWDNREGANDRIFQFNFADCYGRSWVLSAERDFEGSESALIDAAIEELRNYDYVFTYYGKAIDRDWGILDKRCKALGKLSPIVLGKRKNAESSRLQLVNNEGRPVYDIDIGQLYEEPMIANFLGNIYPSNELDVVAKAVLGKGKLVGVSSKDIASMPLELQIKYGLVDAQRTQELAMADNFLVLSIIDEIAKFVNMHLSQVCNSGPTVWWSNYYRDVMGIEPSPNAIKNDPSESYKGGDVDEVTEKDIEYRNVAVFDFKQQYPEIAKKYNLSFETTCCLHDSCKNDPTAKLITGQPDIDAKGYWACKKVRGAFPRALETLTELRSKYKRLYEEAERAGDLSTAHEYNVKQQAYKLFSNSGYGVMGQPYFDYGSLQTAETITAFGRTKVNKLKEVVEDSNMFSSSLGNIYRDTDSAFIIGIPEPISNDSPIVRAIVAEANKSEEDGGLLGIPLVYEKWYSKVLIHASKNYMGVDGDTGKLIVKGLVGKKSNQCELVKQVFIRARDYWKNDVDNTESESYIKPIIGSLDNKTIDVEMLRERSKIHQDPRTGYVNSPKRPEKVLGMKHKKRINESVPFWHKVKQNKGDVFFTEDPAEIDFAYYKEPLKTAIEPILKVRGYNSEQINALLNISSVPIRKKKEDNKSRIRKSPTKKEVTIGAN
jgi:DNA polymerase elongation subunit (family B)